MSLAKSTPSIVITILLLRCIFAPSFDTFYIFIACIIVIISNVIMKEIIFKPLYLLSGMDYIPILGLGARPHTTIECNVIVDGIMNNSFGMPSGHSQFAFAISIYLILKMLVLLNNTLIISTKFLIIICIFIIFGIACFISYSRVYYEKCHTIQQVIIGSILGIVSGIIMYLCEKYVKHMLQN